MAHPRIDLVYFNAGGGHRAAAEALQGVLLEREPGWSVRLVDLFRVLDPEGWFPRLTGFAPETYYNKRLAAGFTLGLAQELKVLQAMIRAAHPQLVSRLARHWQHTAPDMVVTLVPNFNRSMGQALSMVDSRVPFVTVMTDLADLPPHFWIEPGYTQHLVCGTERAMRQALDQGLPPTCVHRVSGMIMRPSLRRIAASLDDQPLILMCGRNASLAQALARQSARGPRHVVGHTTDVAHWLRLADYFIGKPGPGSLSEALHCGLPVIVARNAWTMPQERWNTEWVREQGLGLVLGGFTEVRAGVQDLLAELPRWRASVAQFRNQALFEVAALLRLMADSRLGPHTPGTTGSALTLAEAYS
jgi:hypothetical protein